MFPKKNRIHSFFFKILGKGRIYHSPLFSVNVLKNKEDNNFRVSVVISKKIAKKATERNLLKRRFLSVLKNNKNLLKNDFLYIFYPKKDVQTADFKEIEFEIIKILKIHEKNS